MHLIKKVNFKASHYRNASTDPLGTGHGSLGIRGAHFWNRWTNEMKINMHSFTYFSLSLSSEIWLLLWLVYPKLVFKILQNLNCSCPQIEKILITLRQLWRRKIRKYNFVWLVGNFSIQRLAKSGSPLCHLCNIRITPTLLQCHRRWSHPQKYCFSCTYQSNRS
jgi:hypothetical protein